MASEHSAIYRVTTSGLELRIRLTPKSSRDQLGSVLKTADGDVLQAFVRALPKDGAANKALLALVTKTLRIPRSSASLRSGSKSRIKVVAIDGSPAGLAAKIDQLLSDTN